MARATIGDSMMAAAEVRNPLHVIQPGTSNARFIWTSPEVIHGMLPPQKNGISVLGVPPTKTSATTLRSNVRHPASRLCIAEFLQITDHDGGALLAVLFDLY